MSQEYDTNDDYISYPDTKRKSTTSGLSMERERQQDNAEGENEESKASQKAAEYVRELMAEKIYMDNAKLPNACRLVDQEISKVQLVGRPSPREYKYVDIYREKPIKVTVKVLVPVREHPKFNFVGKLLGPKGNSMKRLQEDTMCKMAVLGRGSMKDRAKEEELRKSLDPKYAHLADDLHVEISALGPPAEAHARVAFALAEVRKYLIPDNNDTIRQEQMREMEIMTGDEPHRERERELIPKRTILKSLPASRAPLPPMRTATRTPVLTPSNTRPVMPAKTKIMSILDRARVAMEDNYGIDDDYYEPEYVRMSSMSSSSSKSAYYPYDYDSDYYRVIIYVSILRRVSCFYRCTLQLLLTLNWSYNKFKN
ncbi:KH domain-containing, RNA-binding, signal transduction-associated protein 2-like isoform X2 [Sitophilus oryzae]|uniref:KH domain-containing, RNA-binding, signal transduction-associated protein 2-like isoform X2 n=1 Tax=Sitophilus oryzae TaxID=7048 RepID=A0A6J2YA68_SITOR|nr:KH domain-containing, RNA-binding, signal transduction-associated protein 2-like isoform X2 [Sitophilus oryzae]